jgi:hypothetical protein
MADWILIPCLKALFAEFDKIAPSRDHASDGSIGDTVHQDEVSDHNGDEVGKVPIHDADHVNEVHAIDVDNTLNESDLTMEMAIQFLLGRCRSGAEKRLRYMIYNRRIWSASSGWVQKTYTGASPHTEHAHFSASYTTSLEASTASWHLEDIPVAWTAADKAYLEQRLDQRAREDLEDITALLDKLTQTVPFDKGGGQHAPVGDGVWNSSYPAEPGAERQLAWVNLQRIQTDLTEIKALLAPPPAKTA